MYFNLLKITKTHHNNIIIPQFHNHDTFMI